MKKWFAILLVLALALSLGCFACAEDALPEEAMVFDSEWNSEDVYADVFLEDGRFKAEILGGDAYYPDGYCWEYAFEYDAEAKQLNSVYGIKFSIRYKDEGGYDLVETLYEDGEATLSLNEEGKLIWTDKKEDAGKGAEMVNIGRFAGYSWQSDRVSLEVFLEDVDALKVRIYWADSAEEGEEWTYACRYNPETGTMDASYVIRDHLKYDENGEETRTNVYEKETAAVFTEDENYNLTVKDSGEEQLDALVFEFIEQKD